MRLVLLAFAALTACDSSSDADMDDSGTSGTETTEDNDTTPDTRGETDGTQTQVDASSAEQWVYFDLETLSVISPATPTDSDDWDLAFRQFTIITNGGVNGTGGVEVAAFEGLYNDFGGYGDAIPPHGWASDSADAGMFDDWYDYDHVSHIVSPADMLYFVSTVEGSTYEVRILDYYDDNDVPHSITLETALRGEG